ncbi:MAG: ABC transporter ATP-binding protein [Fibrobacterales bacterium]
MLDVKNLYVKYASGNKVVRAVEDVSFSVRPGETLGLVGESGCGKSSVGRAVVKLEKIDYGKVLYNGVDLNRMSTSKLKPYRKKIQIIFQDPYSSLNPKMTVGSILAEAGDAFEKKADIMGYVRMLLRTVELPEDSINRYPHEFSGGQRQRIGIARALAVKPEFIVCDEVVSSLDVSVQAQVLNLLKDLQRGRGLSYLFISHDLGVVRNISHRVAVMYFGKIVEIAHTEELFTNPLHPYTKLLLSSIPGKHHYRDIEIGQREFLAGPRVWEVYKGDVPAIKEQSPGHWVREF